MMEKNRRLNLTIATRKGRRLELGSSALGQQIWDRIVGDGLEDVEPTTSKSSVAKTPPSGLRPTLLALSFLG
jgi:hypothetical protein